MMKNSTAKWKIDVAAKWGGIMGDNQKPARKGLGLGVGIGIGFIAGILIATICITALYNYAGNRLESAKAEITDAQEKHESELATQQKQEQHEYIPKILIKDIEISDSRYGGNVISGEIKNSGDKSLSKVEIVVYCLNASGKSICEETFYPVLALRVQINEDEILKPGYSKAFSYGLENTPSEWAGTVDAKISEIEFYTQ